MFGIECAECAYLLPDWLPFYLVKWGDAKVAICSRTLDEIPMWGRCPLRPDGTDEVLEIRAAGRKWAGRRSMPVYSMSDVSEESLLYYLAGPVSDLYLPKAKARLARIRAEAKAKE